MNLIQECREKIETVLAWEPRPHTVEFVCYHISAVSGIQLCHIVETETAFMDNATVDMPRLLATCIKEKVAESAINRFIVRAKTEEGQ